MVFLAEQLSSFEWKGNFLPNCVQSVNKAKRNTPNQTKPMDGCFFTPFLQFTNTRTYVPKLVFPTEQMKFRNAGKLYNNEFNFEEYTHTYMHSTLLLRFVTQTLEFNEWVN